MTIRGYAFFALLLAACVTITDEPPMPPARPEPTAALEEHGLRCQRVADRTICE